MRFFLLVHSDSIKVRDPILTSMMCISAAVTRNKKKQENDVHLFVS